MLCLPRWLVINLEANGICVQLLELEEMPVAGREAKRRRKAAGELKMMKIFVQ